ncbi:hypothetical protein EIN_048010 [Entamoeba invadens IP1]|uniref:Uncharacterized protein n=1 Tax=Entamoeba invadens IP1 TaxID=370355 RepID=A0A0A1UDF8_ENTIV|nr:hypothetical protein EIN_048010 [Entamoeba invadens IP1]ELP94478.1 hypothetical protein EIN_048010 [Entamoeba invadens IP1]|eukprot:XP_004261249.1 hypothetical protein EIN_048010 [Entamoeba invadens IP1]
MLLTTALYIVDALCKRQSFVRLFITQDEHLLNSISNLLNYQNPIIFELSIEILIAFVDQPTELENFESFIPVLLVASSIVSHLRPVIILLLHKILQCEKTQQKFVDSNGLFLIYNTLLAPQDDELFSCLEILLRLEKAKPVYLDAIVNTNILQPLTEIINKEDDMSLVERCLGIVSLLSTSSFFPNICRSSGLFETCLELIEYPYTKTSTVVTLRAALLIIYRTTTNSLLVKSCTSLKLASKLSNLIKNANQFNPQVQMVVYGILANLIESPEAQKDLLVTKVNTILYLIDLKTVIVEAQPIITTALLVFETLQVRDVKEEYTPKDIERIAEYNSQITRNKSS